MYFLPPREDLPCTAKLAWSFQVLASSNNPPQEEVLRKKPFSVFIEFYLGYPFMKAFTTKCSKLKAALDII